MEAGSCRRDVNILAVSSKIDIDLVWGLFRSPRGFLVRDVTRTRRKSRLRSRDELPLWSSRLTWGKHVPCWRACGAQMELDFGELSVGGGKHGRSTYGLVPAQDYIEKHDLC
jgi:hypothetical protein